MLDQAIVNSRILWSRKLLLTNEVTNTNAALCLEKIFMYLAAPFLRIRYETACLRRDLKIGIEQILKCEKPPSESYNKIILPRQQRCSYCKRSEDKKTKIACSSCEEPICEFHRLYFCNTCVVGE